jgi:predicted glycogen debranching enzyme
MKISFEKSITQDLKKALTLEWLETNGLSGWASSTIIGANTSRYHGLLITAARPPVGRVVLLSKLDETIDLHGRRYELQCNKYPGTLHPRDYNYLEKFEKDLFPVFNYNTEGIKLRKTIVAINGENTTIILYEVIAAISSFFFELQPFIAARYYHNLTQANEAIRQEAKFKKGLLSIQPYDGFETFYIYIPTSIFENHPEWYFNYEYPIEQQRGLDFHEDLFSYGHFKVNLNLGDKFGVIISTQNPSDKDAFQLFEHEKERRLKLFTNLSVDDDITKRLTLAADQFIVRKANSLSTIIAGYPWFTDWGRDTMISLPGLTMVTKRYEDAREILRTFARYVSQGMLPNDFPDIEDEPEYNSVDTALWFFIAIYKYLHYTKDEIFIRTEMMPVLDEIIGWHLKGTKFNINVDEDGLLYAGEPGLTWMDAKLGNKVITPRQGKAVEINALWYNALMIYAELLGKFETSKRANKFERRAENVKRRFLDLFWNDELGYLFDFIDGEKKDSSLRPNQIFALSLPYPLLSGKRAKEIFKIIVEKLYTPFGLRTLSPDDPNYKGNYLGSQLQRANAYHQGTVWGWLMGPFITTMIRFYGEYGRERAKKIINNFMQQVNEAGIGTISEIFDGNTPYSPRGCIAQAWSVGELLRAYVEDVANR